LYKFLDLNRVLDLKNCKLSELTAEIRAGLFPEPIRHDNKLVWRVLEMAALLEAEAAGANAKELTALVSRLVESRNKLIEVVNLEIPPRKNKTLNEAAVSFLHHHPIEREIALSLLFGPGCILHNKQNCA
jgi:hypothetical protein